MERRASVVGYMHQNTRSREIVRESVHWERIRWQRGHLRGLGGWDMVGIGMVVVEDKTGKGDCSLFVL